MYSLKVLGARSPKQFGGAKNQGAHKGRFLLEAPVWAGLPQLLAACWHAAACDYIPPDPASHHIALSSFIVKSPSASLL